MLWAGNGLQQRAGLRRVPIRQKWSQVRRTTACLTCQPGSKNAPCARGMAWSRRPFPARLLTASGTRADAVLFQLLQQEKGT